MLPRVLCAPNELAVIDEEKYVPFTRTATREPVGGMSTYDTERMYVLDILGKVLHFF